MKTTEPVDQYRLLGVDSGKAAVRLAFSPVVDNDFPGAFVNIVRGRAEGGETTTGKVFTMHSDGVGSKLVQHLLHYFETRDERIIGDAILDAYGMNTGDICASGFLDGKWVFSQTLAVNGLKIPKDVIMKRLAERLRDLFALYQSFGFNRIKFLGGETADLVHQLSSAIFDVSVYAEAREEEVIRGLVMPGDRIYGLGSDGRTSWEQAENSGVMSNGATLARTCLMDRSYNGMYPFLVGFGPAFKGRFKVTDQPDILRGMTVSQALLSPTRQYAILIRKLADRLKAQGLLHLLHGISHNTGGGATKVTQVGRGGIVYEKNMPEPPPIFHLIQQEADETWRNMFKTFNCGVGLDIIAQDSTEFKAVLQSVCAEAHVKFFELGVCLRGQAGENQVILKTPFGTFIDY